MIEANMNPMKVIKSVCDADLNRTYDDNLVSAWNYASMLKNILSVYNGNQIGVPIELIDIRINNIGFSIKNGLKTKYPGGKQYTYFFVSNNDEKTNPKIRGVWYILDSLDKKFLFFPSKLRNLLFKIRDEYLNFLESLSHVGDIHLTETENDGFEIELDVYNRIIRDKKIISSMEKLTNLVEHLNLELMFYVRHKWVWYIFCNSFFSYIRDLYEFYIYNRKNQFGIWIQLNISLYKNNKFRLTTQEQPQEQFKINLSNIKIK